MKNLLMIVCSVLFFSLSACKTKAKAGTTSQPTPTNEPTVYKGVTDNTCALEMAFGSPGSGIDIKAYDAMMALISSKKLKYSEKSVGREGETRICMPLTELKGKEKNELIEQLKKIAKDGTLVSLSIR